MPRLKGPVPQVQAKEGPMPQPVKKRRSGWAVLAVAALIASILAVAASPAAATARKPDFESQWKACLGPALEAQDFTDLDLDSTHYDNINCLNHYGITTGRTADAFNPGGYVTRSQMALFLARAATAASISIPAAPDQGFTDVDAADTERADAINSLTAAGIMFGDTATSFDPPSTDVFGVSDYVTRWEMAMFLFAFLDHALESVLVDNDPVSLDGDSAGRVELGSRDGGKSGTRPDDYFADAQRQTPRHVDDRISAIYELGITFGLDGEIGPKGVFDPNGLVTRAQMASFIMRTMGHTNLRPPGLTAQSTNDDTQVSVRDADFKPIAGARTEVFTTNFPGDAFNANGACVLEYTQNQDPGFDECQIDLNDRVTTDDDGNAVWFGVGLESGNFLTIPCTAPGTTYESYTFMAGTRGSDTDYTIYAWQGAIGDVANQADLFKSSPANVLTTLNDPVKAVFTGGVPFASNLGEGIHVRMGTVVTFTVQLRDEKGRPVGPQPNAVNHFLVKEDTYTELDVDGFYSGQLNDQNNDDPTDDVLVLTTEASFPLRTAENPVDYTRDRYAVHPHPDGSGLYTFSIGSPDGQRHVNNRDEVKRLTITAPEGNTLRIVDQTRAPGDLNVTSTELVLADIRFSDNAASARRIVVDAVKWRLRSPRNRNSFSVTVTDQYGTLYRGGDHEVQAVDTVNTGDFPGAYPDEETLRGGYGVSTTGRRSIGYTHGPTSRPLTQMVALTLRVPGSPAVEADAGPPDNRGGGSRRARERGDR